MLFLFVFSHLRGDIRHLAHLVNLKRLPHLDAIVNDLGCHWVHYGLGRSLLAQDSWQGPCVRTSDDGNWCLQVNLRESHVKSLWQQENPHSVRVVPCGVMMHIRTLFCRYSYGINHDLEAGKLTFSLYKVKILSKFCLMLLLLLMHPDAYWGHESGGCLWSSWRHYRTTLFWRQGRNHQLGPKRHALSANAIMQQLPWSSILQCQVIMRFRLCD